MFGIPGLSWSNSQMVNLADHSAATVFAVELWNDGTRTKSSVATYLGGSKMTLGELQKKPAKSQIALLDGRGKESGRVAFEWDTIER